MIRQATEADVLSIHRLQTEWADEAITYGFIPADPDKIKAALGPYFLVAEVNGNVVGFVSGASSVSNGMAVIPQGDSYLEIDDLYVALSFRGQKIGSMLVDQLLAIAAGNGISRALVYSASRDIHTVLRFYESHGFKSWYIQMFREL